MITDALATFLPYGSNLPVTNAAVPSNVIDLLGLGVGVTPQQANQVIGVTRTVFGEDAGIGGVKPLVECAVGTAFAGGTSINCAFQGAQDTVGTGQPGAWQTFMETGALLTAQLTAGAIFGRFDFPPEFPVGFQPRFLRLLFTPVGTFTAGNIAWAMVTMGRPDLAQKFMAKNFQVVG